MKRRTLGAGLGLGLGLAALGVGGAARAQSAGAPAAAMRELTSLELSRHMGPGWNLGNALEAIGGETAWGNAATTQPLVDAVAAAGFRTLRIPVAWRQHADAQDRIDPAWLARVAEVVGYARQAGLHVLLNVHWDGGWLVPTHARQAEANARLARYWTQIATHFRDHGDTLLFAGTNEVMVEGDYGPPTAEHAAVQNGFNQVFVDAVRATGGHNRVRHLVVQGFNTNIDHTLAHFKLPTDVVANRLMVEVHYYDPFQFTLAEEDTAWQWGKLTTDPAHSARWGDEAHADAQFEKMKARFIDGLGVGVILGEYGASLRENKDPSQRQRTYWNAYITHAAARRGLVPVYWDAGFTGHHGTGLFDRASGAPAHPGLIRAIVAAAALGARAAPGAAQRPPAYTWKNVQIVGGGFIAGFVLHPTAPGVAFARTDMGGAYRRDAASGRWQPLLDGLGHDDANLMGVESIALDPTDPARVYLACGTYTAPEVPDGALLRSADGGRSFTRTPLPFKLGGNEAGRGNGERLAVDPNDGRVLFLGTRNDGLWASRDRGASFARVAGFPAVARSGGATALPPGARPGDGRDGIVFVLFDPASARPGQPSRTLYAGVSVAGQPGVYRSDDGGLSWHAPPGQPTAHRPNHGVLAAGGLLYVSCGSDPGPGPMTDGAVWRHDTRSGAWHDITPDRPTPERRFGYAAVAVDARDPQRLIASTFRRPEGEELFLSTDGGAHWRPVLGAGAVFDHARAPYTRDTHLHWLFDIEIDPADPDHALFTTGYGGWETHDLRNAEAGRPTHWQPLATGIEETVALALLSPTRGVPLVSAIGDYSGFVHHDLDTPPAGNPKPPFFGNTHDVAGAELRPEVIVRVGKPREGTGLGYSLDGGATWRQPASVPVAGAAAGHVAVSANGATWVWTPHGQPPHATHDQGAHWQACAGLAAGTRVVADRVNPRRFYAIDLAEGRFFESSDGAASFRAGVLRLPGAAPLTRQPPGAHHATARGDSRGGQDRLYATPGAEGALWLAAHDGLYRGGSGDGLQRLPGVERMQAFGFGRAEREGGPPTLYMAGTVNGQPGIHRSTDAGASWLRINDDAHQWGLVLQVAGDPKVFGRVYVGTHGRGILYGQPATAQPAAASILG